MFCIGKSVERQYQIFFRKEIIRTLINSRERKDELVSRQYFMHHISSDISRMEGQHYIGTISATPSRKYAAFNAQKN